MRELDKAWWQQFCIITGAEGEGDGGDGGAGGDGGSNGDGASGEGDKGSQGDDGKGKEGEGADDDGDDPKDTAGLKSALQKERSSAKAAVKEAKRLQKIVDDAALKDKTATEQAETKATKAEEKATKLAAGLKKTALNFAIERVAREMKFKDTDDALSLVDRSLIEVEQDEDDPSEITIDPKTVKAAVKALAEKKKHLIDDGNSDGDGGPSGSKFGGGKGSKAQQTEEDLRKRYPSLQ